MALPPETTPAPTSIFEPAMTPAVRPPTASSSSSEPNRPHTPNSDVAPFTLPKLRLQINDLSHPGAEIFLSAVHAGSILSKSCTSVLKHLYSSPSCPTTTTPSTRSVTLILRDMGGVAYTTGSDLDSDHKEIHMSLKYIAGIRPESRQAEEIEGVIAHELVHCVQYNGYGTCPGGLIEGVADWVRLQCGLQPPHWKRGGDGPWDKGYEHTGYFLEYLEGRFGEGTVRRLNEKLRIQRYQQKPFWTELVGRPVEQLWEDYAKSLKNEDGRPKGHASSTETR